MRALLSLIAVAGLVLAGCLTEGPAAEANACVPGTIDVDGVNLVDTTYDPIDPDRDNAWDHETYNYRTCTIERIGWHPLSEDGVPYRYIGEIDMRGDLDLGAVAVLGNGERPRIVLLDISDRADPVLLATIDQSNTYVTDVKFSEDGKVLYAASQSLLPQVGELSDLPAYTSSSGFTAYDITDPAAPRYLGTVLDGQYGCHMLSIVQTGPTEDAVFCVSQQVRAFLVERGGPLLLNLGFVDYFPQEMGLPIPSGIGGLGTEVLSSGPHDMTVYHEGAGFGEGRSYQVVSHWDSGVRIVDITDLPLMREVGAWKGEGAVHYDGNVHTAMMFDVGDRRYIVATPEYTYSGVVPSVWVLDASDLSDLRLVAEWWHPGEHESQGLYLTTHQWQVAPTGPDVTEDEVRIYLTMNHGGLWVLDFAKILDGDRQGAILGFHLARTPLDPGQDVSNAVLNTWDVNIVDGHIYGSDRATGLWIFHYTDDVLGDERLRGFA